MKPLDKLEKEMFKAMSGIEHSQDAYKAYYTKPEEVRAFIWGDAEFDAILAAKVAVDLAKRAHKLAIDAPDLTFHDFLKSEGIETEN